jgi:hypothetical protein
MTVSHCSNGSVVVEYRIVASRRAERRYYARLVQHVGGQEFVAGDVLAIGGLQNGAHVVVAGANDFMITLVGASTSDPTVRFDYAVAE